jgi:1-phosphofructokinase
MIVTLTANPSFDRTIELSGRLDRGGVIRADAVLEQAGGKGVNISRVASAAGVPTVAVFPAGADSSYTIELEQHGIPCRPVAPTGPIRVNLTLTEPDGTTTKVNSAGTTVDAELLVRLREALEKAAVEATWVVLAGSLPPGAPTSWYAELAESLAHLPVAVAVDTSDDALVALAASLETTRPGLLKPNAHELALLTGDDPAALEDDPRAVAAAAARLVERGAGAVLATLGGAGAVLVTPEGAWQANAPAVKVVSTVGAGDSSLFGYLLGELGGLPPSERLRFAVAYGSAAASLPGTTLPAPHQVHAELVTVTTLKSPGAPAPASPAPASRDARTAEENS